MIRIGGHFDFNLRQIDIRQQAFLRAGRNRIGNQISKFVLHGNCKNLSYKKNDKRLLSLAAFHCKMNY
jgi:hypothetical protein